MDRWMGGDGSHAWGPELLLGASQTGGEARVFLLLLPREGRF